MRSPVRDVWSVVVPVADRAVKWPLAWVVLPMATLSIVPPAVGLIVTTPVVALLGEIVTPPIVGESVTARVADNEVNAPAAGVVPPIAGGDERSSVPPSVRLPEDVTVPVSVKPLTVPVPPTLVTVPDPLLLNVVQSVDDSAPD